MNFVDTIICHWLVFGQLVLGQHFTSLVSPIVGILSYLVQSTADLSPGQDNKTNGYLLVNGCPIRISELAVKPRARYVRPRS